MKSRVDVPIFREGIKLAKISVIRITKAITLFGFASMKDASLESMVEYVICIYKNYVLYDLHEKTYILDFI